MLLDTADFVQRSPDDELKPKFLPRTDRPSGEFGVGFDEALVEQNRCEAGPCGAFLVTELVAQGGSDDKCDEFLRFAPTLPSEAVIDA